MTRKLLLETYGPGLMDAYGCNETGSCAVRLPGKDLYYIYADTHVLNLIDENGNSQMRAESSERLSTRETSLSSTMRSATP
jgi:hypothetical protein